MYVLAPNQVAKAFPYSVEDLKRDNPNTSFPRVLSDALLADWDVFRVNGQEPPPFDPATQTLKQVTPVLVDGKWMQAWDVAEAADEEIAKRAEARAAEVRADRAGRLKDCDWTQLQDVQVDAAAWSAYRQQLRDIPDQAGFPWDVAWPEAPAT